MPCLAKKSRSLIAKRLSSAAPEKSISREQHKNAVVMGIHIAARPTAACLTVGSEELFGECCLGNKHVEKKPSNLLCVILEHLRNSAEKNLSLSTIHL